MKHRIALLIVLQITLLLNSCSSDSGDTPTDVSPPAPVVINTTIKSYSKDYGTTGETITMTGENFSTKLSEIKITFDGVAATILSATATEISFTLPASEKLLPKLEITIENRTVTNSVVNNYSGSIGILPIPSATTWFTIDNGMKSDSRIFRVQMISDKIFYYNMDNSLQVLRTLDGGISWESWSHNGLKGGFYVTANNEGWCDTGFGLSKIPKDGSTSADVIVSIDKMNCVYVDNNMLNGTIVSQSGVIYSTTDGANFTKIYDAKNNISLSAEIDNNHIWTIGYKLAKRQDEFSQTDKPFILYKNNMTDGWKENILMNESYSRSKEIYFVDFSTGFLLINKYTNSFSDVLSEVRLLKTNDGGDTWSLVYNGEKFTKFTFKDANTGWAILENKIYKTTDGAATWTLDYTHDQPIRNIAYKNNLVWAISNDKIIKRYL
jgi:hypothetical protein